VKVTEEKQPEKHQIKSPYEDGEDEPKRPEKSRWKTFTKIWEDLFTEGGEDD